MWIYAPTVSARPSGRSGMGTSKGKKVIASQKAGVCLPFATLPSIIIMGATKKEVRETQLFGQRRKGQLDVK